MKTACLKRGATPAGKGGSIHPNPRRWGAWAAGGQGHSPNPLLEAAQSKTGDAGPCPEARLGVFQRNDHNSTHKTPALCEALHVVQLAKKFVQVCHTSPSKFFGQPQTITIPHGYDEDVKAQTFGNRSSRWPRSGLSLGNTAPEPVFLDTSVLFFQ